MRTVILTCVAILLFSVPAFSEDKSIALFAGVQSPGKLSLTDTPSGAGQILTDPKSVGTFGLRLGHGKVLGGEHTLAYSSNFLDNQSKAFIYNSNLRIQAPLPVVKPYATAGIGTLVSWGQGPSDIGARFAFNYGGGITLQPGPVGIQADIRGYSLPGVQSQTINIAQVSLGIVFRY